ncbi:MAG: hypothetical protein KFW09_03270 [Oscillospiraceae bacterium]|nr:hypothetical protein [Oscillospiraceae bacterium]
MTDYNASINYQCESGILGTSIDVTIDPIYSNQEIRSDIIVSKYDNIRIWGQVKNCKNHIISGAFIKLVKFNHDSKDKSLEGIAHTLSDCNGFYQFDICGDNPNISYKIIVSKANNESKKLLDTYNKIGKICNEHLLDDYRSYSSSLSYIYPKKSDNTNNLYNHSYKPTPKFQNQSCNLKKDLSKCNHEECLFHDTNYKKYILCK